MARDRTSGKASTYARNALVRSVQARTEAAYSAYWNGEPYHGKLPTKASVMAIRFCHGHNGLDEIVAGNLASIGRIDLCGVLQKGTVNLGKDRNNPSTELLEARLTA